ncbi:phosphoesterase [Hyperthermus butylicus DSM 5456]|uniref:Phosphoesterase n=2 Tax=Hyperthermus butylicus TaxID=54248 RepID=A2BKN8_HYPBU|nr:phosphoesterase [Hyperthermus butylicus DSM 5456]
MADMLVGLVSDTHDDVSAARRAAEVFSRHGVEVVLHLGDVVAPFTLKVFGEAGIRRLYAVYGNNCGERLGLQRLAVQYGYRIEEWPLLVEAGNRRILMLHGVGSQEKTRELVEALAASQRYDVVAYGHTHQVDVRRVGGVLVVNPGEACGCLTGRKTVAILDTETLSVEIVELS